MGRVSRFLVSVLLAPAALGACAAEDPVDGFAVRRVEDFEAPEEDGNLTADERARQEELTRTLTAAHGTRPRRYNGLFNGSNEAERCYADLVGEVTADVNARLAARGYDERVDEAMIATNFITEGGYFVLNGNQNTGIDGFGSLGVDTLAGNYRALKPYLHQRVRDLVEAGDRNVEQTNERGETVHSVTGLDIEEGAYANAGMFAWSMAMAARDMNDPTSLRNWCQRQGKTAHPSIAATNMSTLPAWQQFFWATVYFNAGPGTGKKLMCSKWLGWATTPHRGAENSMNAHFNAQWRTATYRFIEGTAGTNLASYCERQLGQACTCDRCAWTTGGCAACAAREGCGWCAGRYVCTAAGTCGGRHVTDAAECTSDYAPYRPCADAISCGDCFGRGSCGWCAATNSCMDGDAAGPFTGTCADWAHDTCPGGACTSFSCSDCMAEAGCGWCIAGNSCAAAGASGPAAGVCSDVAEDWRGPGQPCPQDSSDCTTGEQFNWTTYTCEPIPAECLAASSCDACVAAGCQWAFGSGSCVGSCGGSCAYSDVDCTGAPGCPPGQVPAAMGGCQPVDPTCGAQSVCEGCAGAGCVWCAEGAGYCNTTAEAMETCWGASLATVESCSAPTCGGDGSFCSNATDCCAAPAGQWQACVLGSCAFCTGGAGLTGDACDATMPGSCCGLLSCNPVSALDDTRCCAADGQPCDNNPDCCGAMECVSGRCQCRNVGETCLTGFECCGGLICDGATGLCITG